MVNQPQTLFSLFFFIGFKLLDQLAICRFNIVRRFSENLFVIFSEVNALTGLKYGNYLIISSLENDCHADLHESDKCFSLNQIQVDGLLIY